MNKLRSELQTLLSGISTIRPAALRRCRREDFLYTTDLPQIASGDSVNTFLRSAEALGWHMETDAGWILMDRIPEDPPEGLLREPFGKEAKCCASLLLRHPNILKRNGDRVKRMLIKAGEESPEAYEHACLVLHREWASALRTGDGLPDLPLSFLREANGK